MNPPLRSRLFSLPSLVVLLLLSSGCQSLAVQHFASEQPRFEPMKFFEGETHSWGVVENRRGNPTTRFRADLKGVRQGSELLLTQDFTFQNGRKEQRVWHIRQVDDHHYEAKANDVVGVATGETAGNVFRWAYTLTLKQGNPFSRVRFHLWMYLLEDGTMINRVTITKLGIVVAQTTEHFSRGS